MKQKSEPKTRHSTSETQPEEVGKPQDNATELPETSSYTTESERKVIKLS